MLLPWTALAPTVVPPVVQVVGAVVCGPKTLNVSVPVAALVAPESFELIEMAAIAVPTVPVPGAAAVATGAFLTTVEAIALPQVLLEATLAPSPP